MLPANYKIMLGAVATLIGIAGFAPYIGKLVKRAIKPHAFSWLIWSIMQFLVFAAQVSHGGGAGSWAVGAPATLCFVIFVISLFRGEKDITRSDWMFLLGALLGISLWLITEIPLYSVILAVMIDFFAFAPTIKKSYKKPNEESISVFAFSAVSFFISLFALQRVTLTTVLFPLYLTTATSLFVVMVLLRRRFGRRGKRARPKRIHRIRRAYAGRPS